MAEFDWDAFVSRCRTARDERRPLPALDEAVREAVSDPRRVAATVSLPLDPADDGIVYRSADLLILRSVFPRGFVTGIHDHRVPAVIGVWAGHEDNLLYRPAAAGLECFAVQRLGPGEVLALSDTAIHDVHASKTSWCGAIHVYLGDLTTQERSEWPAPDQPERPCDGEEMERQWLELGIATGLVDRTGAET